MTGTAADQVFATEAEFGRLTLTGYLTDNQGTVRDVMQYDSEAVDHLVFMAVRLLVLPTRLRR